MAVYQRGKNWYIDFTFHGQRIREMIGPSRKGADKVIAKRKAEIAENKFLDVRKEPEPVTFYEFAKEYLQWAKANKKPTTYRRDISLLGNLNTQFEKKLIQEITAFEIEKYKARRKGQIKRPGAVVGSYRETGPDGTEKETWYVEYENPEGQRVRKNFGQDQVWAQAFFSRSNVPTRPASVNRELALLKHRYTKAVEWGRVKESPTKKVKLLKGEVRRVRFLLPEEIRNLVSNCADHLRPIVTVALHTGMRKGELLSLCCSQVDFTQGIITLEDTKNHERRDIPMNETVKTVLQGIERRGEHVFSNEDGQRFGEVRTSFETALRRSGINDFRFHDLRHTFASNLVMQGVDIMTVKELMGHKDLKMTLRYAHLAPNHKTKAVTILDQVMSQDPPHTERAAQVIQLSY